MKEVKSLLCYNCYQEIVNLPVVDVKRLEGLSFLCDCCGHLNYLNNSRMHPGPNLDKSIIISSVYDLHSI